MRLAALLCAAAVVMSCGGTATAVKTAAPVFTPPPSPPVSTPTATPAAARSGAPTPAFSCLIHSFPEPATKATVVLANGGQFTITLRPDKAPATVKNFADLSRSKCYDNLKFHRVVPGFVIQGGDPLGNGSGGGNQPTELSDLPFVKGAVGIARAGDIKVSNAFQFFVCIGECRSLDNMYTNFGTVTEGQAVADAVKVGDAIKTITIQ
ncbi:MAG: peptidylprolyl isomerase [Chloroflexi bacterium]|nr:peptidylprolyl isomerase [Chloroflexota bacterium]